MDKRKLVAALAAVALSSAACGGGEGGGRAGGGEVGSAPRYDTEAGLGSPAADLRARLAELLQENVLLTGMATAAVVAGQDARPVTAVLEQNTAALAAVFAGVYGDPVGQGLLALWRRQAAAMLDSARAGAAGDAAGAARAKADLDAVGTELTTLLEQANTQHTPQAVGEDRQDLVRLQLAAVTAQVKKDPAAVTKLKEAADHTPKTAAILAAGIAKLKGRPVEGRLDSIGTVLRSTLSVKLQQHAYLAGMATSAAVAGGDPAPATAALDDNSVELTRIVATVYGDDVGRRFLAAWRRHTALLADYARAAAAGDQAGAAAVEAGLDVSRDAVAALLQRANPNLGRETVATELGVHVDSLVAAIRAQAARDPAQVLRLKEAADHMPAAGLLLAEGIARQFPRKFG